MLFNILRFPVSTSTASGLHTAALAASPRRMAATALLVFLLAAHAGAAFGKSTGPSSVPGEDPNAVAAPIVTGTAGETSPATMTSQPAPGGTLPPAQAEPVYSQPPANAHEGSTGPSYVPGENREAVAPSTVTGTVERP